MGKSTMAAYFIDLLKCQYPKAIVAYFFGSSASQVTGGKEFPLGPPILHG